MTAELFRLFDMDNDGRLTHAEFQSGLVAMGMGVASDPFAVGCLLKMVRLLPRAKVGG